VEQLRLRFVVVEMCWRVVNLAEAENISGIQRKLNVRVGSRYHKTGEDRGS
jgi:hypothetical protein